MDANAIERLLYHDCGLWASPGSATTCATCWPATTRAPRRRSSCSSTGSCREVGSLAAALGGLDGLVFTAGIGERSAAIRARVCARAGWLGLELDEAANRAGGPKISAASSQVAVYAHSDRRGADDRPPHAGRARPGAGRGSS